MRVHALWYEPKSKTIGGLFRTGRTLAPAFFSSVEDFTALELESLHRKWKTPVKFKRFLEGLIKKETNKAKRKELRVGAKYPATSMNLFKEQNFEGDFYRIWLNGHTIKDSFVIDFNGTVNSVPMTIPEKVLKVFPKADFSKVGQKAVVEKQVKDLSKRAKSAWRKDLDKKKNTKVRLVANQNKKAS